MDRLLRALTAWLIVGGCPVVAEQTGVTAALSFQVWGTETRKGVQAVGGEKAAERIEGGFHLKVGDAYVPVEFREGLRSKIVTYQGPPTCVMYREGEKDGKKVYEPAGKFELPGDGKFMVLMQVGGTGKARSYSTLLLPYGDDVLQKGAILVMNQTKREIAMVQDRGGKLVLSVGGTGLLKLKGEVATSVHLQVLSRKKDGEWRMEFSRAYSVFRNSKSACVLYQDEPGGSVRVKFFSGLER